MQHLAVVQSEFLKIASKQSYLWDRLSYEAQIEYRKRHPKSKRTITRHPGDRGQKLSGIHKIEDKKPKVTRLYQVPANTVFAHTLPNNVWGFFINKNQGTLLPRWLKLVKKYNLEELNDEYLKPQTIERKLEINDTFKQAIHELKWSITSDEAKKILNDLGEKILDRKVATHLAKVTDNITGKQAIDLVTAIGDTSIKFKEYLVKGTAFAAVVYSGLKATGLL